MILNDKFLETYFFDALVLCCLVKQSRSSNKLKVMEKRGSVKCFFVLSDFCPVFSTGEMRVVAPFREVPVAPGIEGVFFFRK